MFNSQLQAALPKGHGRARWVHVAACFASAVLLTGIAEAQRASSASASADTDGGESGQDEVAVPSLLGGSVANTENAKETRAELGHQFTDWLWDLPHLIDDPDAPIIQSLRLTGRYHGQYAYVESNQSPYSEWETRRVRGGISARFLQDFRLQSIWKLDGDEFKLDSDNIDNQWIAWRHWEEFGLKFGKQKPLWSQEWSTSSNAILTFERSLLVNQLRPQQSYGLYSSGAPGSWAYGAGYFRGELGVNSEYNEDAEDADFILLSVARDMGSWFKWSDDARWRVDYLHNIDSQEKGSGLYAHSLAMGISGKLNRGRLMTELLYATGGDAEGNVVGLTVLPSIDIIEDKLQFVLRYHLANSSHDTLKLQGRYETAGGVIGDGAGDFYQSLYGGLNWYLRGNQLKVMTGLEYAKMKDPNDDGGDYSGWTFFSGVRLSF